MLRLGRSSGITGLASMSPAKQLSPGVVLVRPLLSFPKVRRLVTFAVGSAAGVVVVVVGALVALIVFVLFSTLYVI